jgi:hypothetical protein
VLKNSPYTKIAPNNIFLTEIFIIIIILDNYKFDGRSERTFHAQQMGFDVKSYLG